MTIGNIHRYIYTLFSIILFSQNICFADTTNPKYELRAVWLSALAADWPIERGVSNAIAQQEEATTYLDRLKSYGYNCVFLHIRPMSDRLYQKITLNELTIDEPFSEYITGERGVEATYDPLQFYIEECHKRGMELHAWINPYRYYNYNSVQIPDDNFNPNGSKSEFDDSIFSSGELIKHSTKESDGTYTTYYIFNPALPETVERITNIVKVITSNYDIDGIVFDDWFYPNGILSNTEAPDYPNYSHYIAMGGTLSIEDWRRSNINTMIATINDTIKSIKPWVRFGVSPAGAAGKGLKSSDALPPLSQYCQASDWQYDGIFSDPIAWLRSQSVDYIAPQLYWETTHPTNPFGPMAQWWSIAAQKFGRHFYAANTLYLLSTEYDDIGNAIKYNNTKENWGEVSTQILLNRQATNNSGCGVITFYSKYITGASLIGVGDYIKANNFQHRSLIPAMTWMKSYNPGKISSLKKDGALLTWEGFENVRYTVYAIPSEIPIELFNKQVEYLIDFTYSTSYYLPDEKLNGYNYAVVVYDRYGNEYIPTFFEAPTDTIHIPTLTFPHANNIMETPFDFEWELVDDATSYIIEIAYDSAMTQKVVTRAINSNVCSSTSLGELPIDTTLWWRVHACNINYANGTSHPQAVYIKELRVLSPRNNDTEISLTPTIHWSMADRHATLQISTSDSFEAEHIIVDTIVSGGSFLMPQYVLCGYTQYYVRLLCDNLKSKTISFTTLEATPEVPSISHPENNGNLFCDEYIKFNPVLGCCGLRIEVSPMETFSGRFCYISENISSNWSDFNIANSIRLSGKPLNDGVLYYLRARASYNSPIGIKHSDYSCPQTFYYRSSKSGIPIVENNPIQVISFDGNNIIIQFDGYAKIDLHNAIGRKLIELYSGKIVGFIKLPIECQPGLYIVSFVSSEMRINNKIIIK